MEHEDSKSGNSNWQQQLNFARTLLGYRVRLYGWCIVLDEDFVNGDELYGKVITYPDKTPILAMDGKQKISQSTLFFANENGELEILAYGYQTAKLKYVL